MSKAKWFKQLTPKMAWDQYVGESIELFISNFRSEGITDVKEMSQKYARDIPGIFPQLYAQDQLNHVAQLLEQHINEKGYDHAKLYSEKELEEIWARDIENLFAAIEDFRKRLR